MYIYKKIFQQKKIFKKLEKNQQIKKGQFVSFLHTFLIDELISTSPYVFDKV